MSKSIMYLEDNKIAREAFASYDRVIFDYISKSPTNEDIDKKIEYAFVFRELLKNKIPIEQTNQKFIAYTKPNNILYELKTAK